METAAPNNQKPRDKNTTANQQKNTKTRKTTQQKTKKQNTTKKQKNKTKKQWELTAATSQNINKLMFSGVWNGGVGGWSTPFLPHPKNLIPLFLNFGELMFCGGGWVGGPRPFRGSWKKTNKNAHKETS